MRMRVFMYVCLSSNQKDDMIRQEQIIRKEYNGIYLIRKQKEGLFVEEGNGQMGKGLWERNSEEGEQERTKYSLWPHHLEHASSHLISSVPIIQRVGLLMLSHISWMFLSCAFQKKKFRFFVQLICLLFLSSNSDCLSNV